MPRRSGTMTVRVFASSLARIDNLMRLGRCGAESLRAQAVNCRLHGVTRPSRRQPKAPQKPLRSERRHVEGCRGGVGVAMHGAAAITAQRALAWRISRGLHRWAFSCPRPRSRRSVAPVTSPRTATATCSPIAASGRPCDRRSGQLSGSVVNSQCRPGTASAKVCYARVPPG